MDTRQFLNTVITATDGFFCLGLSPEDSSTWWELWFRWPDELDLILSKIAESQDQNVYFSSYLFSSPQSTKDNVLPSRTLQADLDGADIALISPPPTILVESSPGRHQGYWILNDEQELATHEYLSKKLSYAIADCDRSGWSLGHKMRVPGTFNHKYLDGPKQVKVVSESSTRYDSSELELLPEVPSLSGTIDDAWIDGPHPIPELGPQELLESIRSKISPKVYTSYNARSKDRSAALWSIECAAFRAGLNRDEVYHLALNSVNNKFSDLRYNGNRELAKDVLRAEFHVKNKVIDVKAAILQIRRAQGRSDEKRGAIKEIVVQSMKQSGEFLHTDEDDTWYIRRDLGRPISISRHSSYLDMVLDLQYGLNSTEPEQSYTAAGLVTHTMSMPATSRVGSLSVYNADTNTLLLHTGRKDVLSITPTSISISTNGSNGVIFPWSPSNDPFNPTYNLECDWTDLAFGSALNNCIGISKDEAQTLLHVWTLFLLLRSAAVSRPVLAFFGQPGAGKSTLFRRIYTIIYGKRRSLGAITTQDDFDHSCKSDPLVVLDNVDTWERWLPDRIALAAAESELTKRKLYTDSDVVIFRRQALIGLTAHNPRFGREDVADRLLLINFERLPYFLPEGDIIDDLHRKRNAIWGSIIRDVQLVLSTPQPLAVDSPQFRVEDFARMGYRIALAINKAPLFISALKRVQGEQRKFSLEEDSILVSSIKNMIRRRKDDPWYTPGHLWSELEKVSPDVPAFQKTYRNAVVLNRKFWALQEALKELFDIQWKPDPVGQAVRVWHIGDKNGP